MDKFFDKMRKIRFGEDETRIDTKGFDVSNRTYSCDDRIDSGGTVIGKENCEEYEELLLRLNQDAKRRLQRLNHSGMLSEVITKFILSKSVRIQDGRNNGLSSEENDRIKKSIQKNVQTLLSYLENEKYLELEVLLGYHQLI